jgi:hypothetical protein
MPYALGLDALKQLNAQKMIRHMDEMPAANADAPDLTLADINSLVHELRPQK